jgi:allantoinase
MEKVDLIIRNGMVIRNDRCSDETIAVNGGKIVGILDKNFAVDAREVVDAQGLAILPGAVDAHSHIWEPTDYEYREDFYTGTCAAAAGGITTIIEMPLSVPPVFDEKSFNIRYERAKSGAIVDFALWGSFIPDAVPHFGELAGLGCVAYKAFLSHANPNYPHADDFCLLKGMKELGKIHGLVGVHAENYSITEGYSREYRDLNLCDGLYHEESRPEVSEMEAVQRAVLFAEETGCRLHICHLSSSRAGEIIKRAKARGVSLTVETCPHYLTLTVEDLSRCGGFAKCNPPLRSKENQDRLWEMIENNEIDCIATDHTPYTDFDRAKHGGDIWEMPAGIGGSELFLPLLIDEGFHKRNVGLEQIARLTALNPARIFGLYPRKGAIDVGFDADLTFIDLNRDWIYRAREGLMKADCCCGPYEGRAIKGKIVRTMLRGITIYDDGVIKAEKGVGRFVSRQ